MRNWLKLTLSVSFFVVCCNASELSNLEKYTKRALVNYGAKKVALSSEKSQSLKQHMLMLSQGYLRDVWAIEALNDKRSVEDWDMAFMSTENGLLKALLVSKICDYSFIHDVPEHIKKDVEL